MSALGLNDVTALVKAQYAPSESPWYFLGRLSMAVALQVKAGATDGREALEEFIASPLPTPELQQMLQKEMKK